MSTNRRLLLNYLTNSFSLFKKLLTRGLRNQRKERTHQSLNNQWVRSFYTSTRGEQLCLERGKLLEVIACDFRGFFHGYSFVTVLMIVNHALRARDFNIMLDDVAITHLSYGNEFSKAVEQKQVAQQEAERSRYVVMKSEQEKRAAVIRAEGESEAAKLISEATASAGMGLIELRKNEAMKENAATMARSPHMTYVPGAMSMIMCMPGAR